jgi:hypothetical protein
LETAEAEFLAVVEPLWEEGAVVAEEEEEEEEEVVVVEEEEEGALGVDANPSLQSEEIHFMKFLFPKWFITTLKPPLNPCVPSSVPSSICPSVPSWSVYSDGAKKTVEYRRGACSNQI